MGLRTLVVRSSTFLFEAVQIPIFSYSTVLLFKSLFRLLESSKELDRYTANEETPGIIKKISNEWEWFIYF